MAVQSPWSKFIYFSWFLWMYLAVIPKTSPQILTGLGSPDHIPEAVPGLGGQGCLDGCNTFPMITYNNVQIGNSLRLDCTDLLRSCNTQFVNGPQCSYQVKWFRFSECNDATVPNNGRFQIGSGGLNDLSGDFRSRFQDIDNPNRGTGPRLTISSLKAHDTGLWGCRVIGTDLQSNVVSGTAYRLFQVKVNDNSRMWCYGDSGTRQTCPDDQHVCFAQVSANSFLSQQQGQQQQMLRSCIHVEQVKKLLYNKTQCNIVNGGFRRKKRQTAYPNLPGLSPYNRQPYSQSGAAVNQFGPVGQQTPYIYQPSVVGTDQYQYPYAQQQQQQQQSFAQRQLNPYIIRGSYQIKSAEPDKIVSSSSNFPQNTIAGFPSSSSTRQQSPQSSRVFLQQQPSGQTLGFNQLTTGQSYVQCMCATPGCNGREIDTQSQVWRPSLTIDLDESERDAVCTELAQNRWDTPFQDRVYYSAAGPVQSFSLLLLPIFTTITLTVISSRLFSLCS